jgi:hypothetical protein
LKVKLGVVPATYKVKSIKFGNQKSFFSAATVIQYLLSQTGLPQAWIEDIDAIFNKYPLVDKADVGSQPTGKRALASSDLKRFHHVQTTLPLLPPHRCHAPRRAHRAGRVAHWAIAQRPNHASH